MHYYQFNIGDYASHTSRLSPMEDLAYRRLIDLYYLNEQPLNGCSTDVAREVGLIEHVDSVAYVLSKFFTKEENTFKQKRIDLEIKKYRANSKNKSKAGKASAKSRKDKALSVATGVEQVLNTTTTDEQLNINHKPRTNNQEPSLKDIQKTASLEAFEMFWSGMALSKKAKPQASKLFLAKVKEFKADPIEFANNLIADTRKRRSNKQFGFDKLSPATYLNNNRWEDDHDTSASGGMHDLSQMNYQSGEL